MASRAQETRDIFLLSQYCVKRQDFYTCCAKSKIFMLTILYYLITTNDWVSTNDIAMQTRIDKPWTMYCLKKLFKWGIVEKRYIPSRGGVAALWRVKEDAFNGYDKKHVLELFAKHIRMCVEHTA